MSIDAAQLPPLPAAYPAANPFDGKVTISTAERDYFAWPCMSGEKYAPVVVFPTGGSGGYSSSGAWPTVTVQSSSTNSNTTGTITWPSVPGVYPGSGVFTGVTVEATLLVNLQTSVGGGAPSVRFADGISQGLFVKGEGTDATYSGNVGALSFSHGSAPFPLGALFAYKATVAVDGTRKTFLGGILQATDTTTPGTTVITPTATVFGTNSAATPRSLIHVAGLKVTYGTPT